MAFRSGKRKDVKKQSYYVWFLGAKESKGLRGEEYIRPVLRHLVDKERELEPMKVTLQVSTKGLKIIQNVPRRSGRAKTEQVKHFIPHHAVTCVTQEQKPDDDVVCCILLIYNPLTRCPVHVHAYRCDSVETASQLRNQLQVLVDRPENQKKFREIENRLAAKGLLPAARNNCHNSDGRSTRTDGSDRTEDSSGGSSEREVGVRKEHLASLYDSLAAELRERLNNPNSCPILLPPKDYDTVSRRQGRLAGIDRRRSTNYNLVGLNKAVEPPHGRPAPQQPQQQQQKAVESSASAKSSSNKSSSGIGSDEALSSAIQEVASHPDFESKEIDPDTSSDDEEEWPEAAPDEDDDEDEDDQEDEVVPSYEWRRPPHHQHPHHSPRYHQHHQSPPQQQQQVTRRSRSSPDEEDDPRYSRHHSGGVRGIVDKFERKTTSPPLEVVTTPYHHKAINKTDRPQQQQQQPLQHTVYRGVEADIVATEVVANHKVLKGSRSRDPYEDPSKKKSPEVVYRRHSNPLDKKLQRESRPLSYPAAIEPVKDPARPKFKPQTRAPPPEVEHHSRNFDRLPAQQQHYPVDRHSPEVFYRESRPVVVSPVNRQSSPAHEQYQRQRQDGRAFPVADSRAFPTDSRAFVPARYAEPPLFQQQGSRPGYHPAEDPVLRRRSGYFDLPVDPRDYRHSFVESPFRRLPLNSQY